MYSSGLASIIINFMENEIIYFKKLIESINKQSYKFIEVVIIDKTADMKIKFELSNISSKYPVKIVQYIKKAGFAENYNYGIHESNGEFVFVLNPDTMLKDNCIEELVLSFKINSNIGCVSPKILRMDKNGNIFSPPIIDSTGMTLNSRIRHHDRGEEEVDIGQYENACYIFGVTGAAAFFRRECLNDIQFDNQFYDEDYWLTREDADISWRINNYGWANLYWPKAVCYHVRTDKPGSRKKLSKVVRMHGVKNRYMLLINNISLKNYLKNLHRIIIRDIFVIIGVFIFEWESIYAFKGIWIKKKKLILKRRKIKLKVKKELSDYWFDRSEVYLE